MCISLFDLKMKFYGTWYLSFKFVACNLQTVSCANEAMDESWES